MKAFTNISQSRKLAEFLPLESADMYWWFSGRRYYIEAIDDGDFVENVDIRAWSLTALLDILPSSTLDSSNDHHYRLHCNEKFTEWHDNAIDACVEMILKLNELKML